MSKWDYTYNSYKKLISVLPETDKMFLKGIKMASEECEELLSEFKDNYNAEENLLQKVSFQEGVKALSEAARRLETFYKEAAISCIECNHYSIDKDGNVFDDNTGHTVPSEGDTNTAEEK